MLLRLAMRHVNGISTAAGVDSFSSAMPCAINPASGTRSCGLPTSLHSHVDPHRTACATLCCTARCMPCPALQDVINREAALWQRGVMSVPRVIHELLAALLLLADRVIALQVQM
jgi:hypothetical protein